jgi:Type VI secretion system (T6SS), amidase effector protein 4
MLIFNELWLNHPGRNRRPCNFTNQCAIRMGIALQKTNVNMSTFKGAKCWHGHEPKHILRAQELAD